MSTNTIDLAHSEIGFSVRHMMFAKVRGQFKTWTANLDFRRAMGELLPEETSTPPTRRSRP